jgi:hypothetical protein
MIYFNDINLVFFVKFSIPVKKTVADTIFLATAIGTPLKKPLKPSFFITC